MRRPPSRRSLNKTSLREPFTWALAATVLLFLTQALLQWVVGRLTGLFTFSHSASLLFLCLPPLGCICLACLFVTR